MLEAARARGGDSARRHSSLVVLWVVLLLLVGLGAGPPAHAAGIAVSAAGVPHVETRSQDLGPLSSTAETQAGAAGDRAPDGQFVSRDGGVSATFINPDGIRQSLWIFGDTVVSGAGGATPPTALVLGATAAVSDAVPGRVPLITERGSAGSAAPDGVSGLWPADDTFSCPSGTVGDTWERGASSEPQAPWMVLVADWGVCATDPPFSAIPRRSGFAEVDTRTWRVTQHDVFGGATARLSAPQIVGAPVIWRGFLYSLESACRVSSATCTASGIYISRARWDRSSDWKHATRYRWWDGRSWTADDRRAVSVIAGARPFLYELDVKDITQVPGHHARFALTEQPDGSGDFTVYYANTLTSWSPGPVSHLPDRCRGTGDIATCRAINLHPELSTRNRLLYSWYSPGDATGHVRLASMPW